MIGELLKIVALVIYTRNETNLSRLGLEFVIKSSDLAYLLSL